MIKPTIDIEAKVKTVGDIRSWLAEVDRCGVPDDAPLCDGPTYLWVALREPSWSLIECGDHLGTGPYPQDMLIDLHVHHGPHDYIEGKPE